MKRIISLNCNGIRSAAKKGLFDWLEQQNADVLCLQETKAQPDDLAGLDTFAPKGWHAHFNSALRKGYSPDVCMCGHVNLFWRLLHDTGCSADITFVCSDNNPADAASRKSLPRHARWLHTDARVRAPCPPPCCRGMLDDNLRQSLRET